MKDFQERLLLVSSKWGECLISDPEFKNICSKAIQENPWFNHQNILQAISAICDQLLESDQLSKWLEGYQWDDTQSKKIGIVCAGNIPFVGFFDILCVLASPHIALVKTSSKDSVLINWVLNRLNYVAPEYTNKWKIVERLNDIDAIMVTGSNNSATIIKSYYPHKPCLFRTHKTSVAVISGGETEEDLQALSHDIYSYFGLGCRNVSMVYVPKDFDIQRLFASWVSWEDIIHHHKYKNNYDYNIAMYSLAQKPFLTNGFVVLLESNDIHSRLASIHYQRYDNIEKLCKELDHLKSEIQVVATQLPLTNLPISPLGKCQNPSLWNYPDGIDIISFLQTI